MRGGDAEDTRRGAKTSGTDGSVHAAPGSSGNALGTTGALGRSRQSPRFRGVEAVRTYISGGLRQTATIVLPAEYRSSLSRTRETGTIQRSQKPS